MRHPLLLGVLLLLLSIDISAQSSPVLSPRTANYDMQIRLDTEKKKLYAKTTLLWRNPSQDTIRELQFHLYYNAFKNTESTFAKEAGGLPSLLTNAWGDECGWSWSEITQIKDEYGNDLSGGMHFIQPDDNNTSDQTVLRVPLQQTVLPDGQIRIVYEWEAKIPKTMIRTGYNMDFYFFAQWFPKVGVYEAAGVRYAKKGQWNCHQYHASGEYYSDFGVYNVELIVPQGYVVGASGVLTAKKDVDEKNTSWTFKAEDVIDFTWTTSPHFIVQEEKWKDVDIKLLCYPGHEHFGDRYFRTVKNSLAFMDEYLGPYPYSSLTIVDPPIHGLFTGGMEYPTLFTSISLCFIPAGIKTTETLIVHEFVHQYFMQMVATHEVEEPWMDEGITTYYEGRIMDKYEGIESSVVDWMGIKVGNAAYNRSEFMAIDNIKIADNSYKSWEYKHGGYSRIAYNKTAVWLKTLEGLIGQSTFDKIMKTYFDRWQFKHPCKDDFIEIVNEVVRADHKDRFGEDMQWFFDQVLEGSDMCDYKLASISNQEITAPAGFLGAENECVMPAAPDGQADKSYRSKVILHRLGEVKLPVEVKITFDNGDEVVEYWDGLSRSVDFTFVGPHQISAAEIDPDRKLWLDANWLNNSYTFEKQSKGIRKYFSRFLTNLQHIMESINILI
ncbi:MAG: M1 family metallopeptidase [Bacteroidota bacterium]